MKMQYYPIGGGLYVTRKFTKRFFDKNIAPIRKEVFKIENENLRI